MTVIDPLPPRTPGSVRIILMGTLMVNVPVVLLMLAIIFVILLVFGDQAVVPALLMGSFAGWMLWGKLLEQWRRWGIRNGVEPERLYRMGKFALINFYRYRIIKEEERKPESK